MANQDPHKVENSSAKAHAGAAEIAPTVGKRNLWSGQRLQFWLFCVLLGLALIGMGLTQATESGGALYWLILLWVYALSSLLRAWSQARQHHDSIWSEIHLHFFHWLGALSPCISSSCSCVMTSWPAMPRPTSRCSFWP